MNDLAEFVVALAKKGGDYAREHNHAVTVGSKNNDPRDVITNIDLEINAFLTKEIAEAFPDDIIYSEEAHVEIPKGKRVWALDPIDGTSNYARALPFYNCCITVLNENGNVEVAAMYAPALGECFVFADGESTLNGEPITTRQTKELRKAYVNFHPGRREEDRQWAGDTKIALLGNAKKNINLASAALDLCYIACGRIDALVYGTFTTFDNAGAIELLRAAGGEVYNYQTKEPVAYTTEPQRLIATGTPELLEQYFELINTQ